MSRIVATGSMAFDQVKTPSGFREKALGGSVNYFSLSASFFAPVGVVGVVGEDYPKDSIDLLSQSTVDTSGVKIKPGKTFFWAGEYGEDLSEAKTLTTCLNVFSDFDPKLPEHYRSAEFLFLANADPETQLSVIHQMKGLGGKKPFVGCDTMNYWIASKKSELLNTLKHVDVLTINETEAFMLSDSKNLVEASKAILKMGPQALVVKRGEYGAVLFYGNEVFCAPAYPLEVVKDPTGAGDVFAGGFMGYLARNNVGMNPVHLRKAIVYGTVMASFVVEDFSFDALLAITGKDIQNRYNKLENMTYFHMKTEDVLPRRHPESLSVWTDLPQ